MAPLTTTDPRPPPSDGVTSHWRFTLTGTDCPATTLNAELVPMQDTPVDVTDELFAQMQAHFTDEQMVELTALLTVVNLDRLNAAFGIASAGFSEGMVCVPDRR